VAYAPSVAALLLLTAREPSAQKPYSLVIGNPTGDLTGAAEEAASVAAQLGVTALPGQEATTERIVQELEKASHAHLATHAYFEKQDPLNSGLRLAGADVITCRQIMNLTPAPDFAFLSACETGVQEVLPGEDLMGLPRAFLYAGTRTLVQSLWRVSDHDAVPLIADFYDEMRRSVTSANALRTAMMRARKRCSHSWYWAPFIVYGYDAISPF
jgi:CHAT domain-containing protein